MLWHLQNFDPEDFLSNHWQQAPKLIRGAIPDLENIIDGDELAGLAMEPTAEARLIEYERDKDSWHLTHGPFQETQFQKLTDKDWTLLVQAVDHWLPEVRDLMRYFHFLPSWRIDDVMVSYAVPGGGVGPHYDQYDVFLIQGQGKREWKIGQMCSEDSELISNLPVKVLAQFEEEETWVLEPGDILYLPPALAHWGTSVDSSITYSVGFRAPSRSEVVGELGHFLGNTLSEFDRYSDSKLQNRLELPHQIQQEDIERVRQILLNVAKDDASLSQWLGQYMTEAKYDDVAVETGDWTFEEFVTHWQNAELIRNPSCRMACNQQSLFVDGQRFDTQLDVTALNDICDREQFLYTELSDQPKNYQHTLWILLNAGAVFFET